MDKVKNFFSPGHSADDEVLYGAQPQRTSSGKLGKVSGEGTHFGSSHDAESSPQSANPDQKTTGVLSQPQSEPLQDDTKGKVAGAGSHFDSGRHTEGAPTTAPLSTKDTTSPADARLTDPRSSRATTGPRSTEPTSDITPTSERGNVSGAGHMETRPAEDASVTSIKSGVPGSKAQEFSTNDHIQPDSAGESHAGRDAALGVGAGGAAVAAAGKAWKPGTLSGFEDSETDPHNTMPGSFPGDSDNPYRTAHIDPRVDSKSSTPTKTASNTTRHASPPAAKLASQQATKPDPVEKKSHVGRDTGVAAAGAGVAGLGASEAVRRHDQNQSQAEPKEVQKSDRPVQKDDGHAKSDAVLGAAGAGAGLGTSEGVARRDQHTESTLGKSDRKPFGAGVGAPSQRDFGGEEPKKEKTSGLPNDDTHEEKDHKGRNAGIIGAAAGAVGLGALVGKKSSKEDPKKEEPELSDKSVVDSTQPHGEAPSTIPPTMTKPAGLDDQRYDPTGTGKQNLTPARTLDQSGAPLDESSNEKPHHGRDAGIASGAGVAGLGASAHEASKHRDASETSKKAVQQTPEESISKEQHHYGRDTGIAAAGTGAAGLGAYEVKKHHDQPEAPTKASQPASQGSTVAPPDRMSLPGHNRNTSKGTLDDATAALLARNSALEEAGSKHANQPQSGYQDQQSKLPETRSGKDEHQYGRDAGLAAGAGGLGLGAYEAKKHHDQIESEATQQPADQSITGAGHSAVSQRTAKPSNYPEHSLRREVQPDDSNHAARNTALGATGVGAGAYGAHELTRHDNKGENWPLKDTNEPQQSRYPQHGSYGQTPQGGDNTEIYEQPERQGHTTRNVALGGAAAAGAGAYAGHELSQHEAEKLDKQQLAEQKARQKEFAAEQAAQQKALADKSAAKEARQQEKQLAKEEKQAEKDAAKAEKKHEKEIAAQEKEREKQEKQHQKEAQKAEKRHSKELEEAGVAAGAGATTAAALHHEETKEDQERPPVDSQGNLIDSSEKRSIDSDEKKKHGLRGLLHKIAHPGEKEEERTPESPSSSDHHDRQKLHKYPPTGYAGDERTPAYADYAVKDGTHPGAKTVGGGHTAPDAANDPTKLSTGDSEETKELLEKENKFLSKHFRT